MLGDLATVGWSILAGAGALALSVLFGLWQRGAGKRQERADRAARDATDYRNTRKEIDNADLGHGATDAERVKRLREIADKRSR
jgi:Flp pilus assembly protein TadB